MSNNMMMFEEEQRLIQQSCDLLAKASNALAVLVIDKNGQEITRAGDTEHLDITSLSSLFAGNVAATGGIARLINEKEFSGQFHEGEKTHVHVSLVAQRAILVIFFDHRSSLGLVRLRVKKTTEELTRIFESLIAKSAKSANGVSQVFGEITDDDIDNLFKD